MDKNEETKTRRSDIQPEFWRLPDVLAFTGFKSRSHLYTLAKAGRFPLPIEIGPNSIAWRRREVEAWAAALPVAEPGRRRDGNWKKPPTNRGRKGNGHRSGAEATA